MQWAHPLIWASISRVIEQGREMPPPKIRRQGPRYHRGPIDAGVDITLAKIDLAAREDQVENDRSLEYQPVGAGGRRVSRPYSPDRRESRPSFSASPCHGEPSP